MIGGFNVVKIPLTSEQIKSLLVWRDQHKELVRALVIPFDDCCIISSDAGAMVKARKSSESCYVITASNIESHEIYCKFLFDCSSWKVVEKWGHVKDDFKQNSITVWATVSAYIVNFQPELVERDQGKAKSNGASVHKAIGKTANKAADRVVYLNPITFTHENESGAKRKYTPCENAFSVRGHYRHYKSGKVVYVHPYEKNTGKEKDKRNKVLKIGEV